MRGYWWCEECQEEVPSYEVTNDECHDAEQNGCGCQVEWVDEDDGSDEARYGRGSDYVY